MKNVVIAITGASGSIYAKRLIEVLSCDERVERISVILTKNAIGVVELEVGSDWKIDKVKKVVIYDNNDFYTPVASGSSAADVMVIVPCSMGMIGRIASGISNDLISRAADVMLKERRKLVLVPRETPMSLIHLRNLVAITESGGVVLPASPAFYTIPKSVDQLVDTVVDRILMQIDLEREGSYKWKGDETSTVIV